MRRFLNVIAPVARDGAVMPNGKICELVDFVALLFRPEFTGPFYTSFFPLETSSLVLANFAVRSVVSSDTDRVFLL